MPREADLKQFIQPVLKAILEGSGWTISAFHDETSIAEVHSGEVSAAIRIETRRHPRPQALRERLEVLQWVAEQDSLSAVVVFAERMTAALAARLREWGVGYFDLYGACLLRWPGLYIERGAGDTPILPAAQHLLHEDGLDESAVLGPRAWKRHRVLRGLLSYPARKWQQKELAEEVELDRAAVNRVISFLVSEHHADHEGKGPNKVVFLTNPGHTLGVWAGYGKQAWSKLRKEASSYYSLASNADEIKRTLAQAVGSQERLAFTLTAGSDYYGSYLRDDQVYAYYGGNLPDLAQAAELEPVERGANVVLLPLRDEGLLYLPLPFAAHTGASGPVCPVQLYLDMRAAGGRYAEQAESLRKVVLRY